MAWSPSSKFEVDVFDGSSNFSTWKIRLKASMVLQGLWKAVTGDFPHGMYQDDKEDLMDRALSTIFMSVSDIVLHEISGEKTPASALKKLEELYLNRPNIKRRLDLKRRLYSFQMSEGTQIKQHLDDFTSLIFYLEDAGVKIEDEDKAMILLCSLPTSYENFVDIVLNGKDNITLEGVRIALKDKDLREKFSDGENDHDDGLMAKGPSKSRNRKSKCFECGELGHFKRECPKVKRGGKPN